MGNPNYESLRDAIARNSAAVLSLPSAGMARHHKTRFLAETENGFWIESAPTERPLIEALKNDESPVGVAFKAGHSSVAFTAPIHVFEPAFRLNESTVTEALFLPFPENFRQLQRRNAYRVTLPMGHDLNLRMWHIPEHAILRDRPLAAREIHMRMTNVCVLGLGAIARPGRDCKRPGILINERLRILLTSNGQELLTEGRVIHFRESGVDQLAFGINFKKLEKDIEGRQTMSKLTELVGIQQREEIKRRRAMATEAA
jgi:hypothetical protein